MQKYSDYNLEQLMKVPKYVDMCNKFLSLAKDGETEEKLKSILYQGGYKEYNLYARREVALGVGRNNPFIDIKRRLSFAYMIVRNQKTFDQIVEHNIQFFYGTNANELPAILKEGIKPSENITRQEELFRMRKRHHVNFTNVIDAAEEYAVSTESLKEKNSEELNFPVIIGTTYEEMNKSCFVPDKFGVSEVKIERTFPKDSIKVVMVPSSRVDFVKKMCGADIIVLANDDIDHRFYVADYNSGEIMIDEDKFNDFRNGINQKEPELKGVSEAVSGRNASKLREILGEIFGKRNGASNGRKSSK